VHLFISKHNENSALIKCIYLRRMKYPLLLLSLSLTITIFGQDHPTSGLTNMAEAKNLTVNGLKEGKWIEYFGEENDLVVKTDKKHSTGYTLTIYKADKVCGAQQFYVDGKLTTEIIHTGKGQSIYKSYYPSGKLMSETTYNNGVLLATKNYDENGNEIK
jgi:hypothetical protein